jgi:hypothetical protein
MLTRKRFLLVATLLVAGGGAVVLLLPLRPPRVTCENFERIRKGMTRANVVAVLGEPGDYTTRPVEYVPAPIGLCAPVPVFWMSDELSIRVWFDR